MNLNCTAFKQSLVAGFSLALWLLAPALGSAQSERDALEALRADLKADRKAVIAKAMTFTDQENQAFWPIYRSYRAETERVTDRVVELVLEYTDLYPNVPEARATQMLKEYYKAEADLLSIKQKYLKKLGKVLPPSKLFRFAQLDHRFDLGTRLVLAASLPILPSANEAQAQR